MVSLHMHRRNASEKTNERGCGSESVPGNRDLGIKPLPAFPDGPHRHRRRMDCRPGVVGIFAGREILKTRLRILSCIHFLRRYERSELTLMTFAKVGIVASNKCFGIGGDDDQSHDRESHARSEATPMLKKRTVER